jgi:hypothetical protein
MKMQELEITIDKDGKVEFRVVGGHGGDCLALTEGLENAIGEVSERVLLPEYYECTGATEHRRIRGT